MEAQPQTNWKHYIAENFFATWEQNTTVDLTGYAFLFEHHFDLETVENHVKQVISEAADPEKMERYHRSRIRTLTQIFVEAVLDVSDDGKHITSKNIERAKQMMEGETRCIYKC